MPRKQQEVKPIYPLVHEFKDSMERVLQEAAQLMTVCETLIELGQIKDPALPKLQARLASLKAALYGDE